MHAVLIHAVDRNAERNTETAAALRHEESPGCYLGPVLFGAGAIWCRCYLGPSAIQAGLYSGLAGAGDQHLCLRSCVKLQPYFINTSLLDGDWSRKGLCSELTRV